MATEKRQRQRANRQLRDEHLAKQERRASTKKRVLIGIGIVAGGLLVVLGLAFLGGAFSGDDDEGDTLATGFQLGTGECPPADGVDEPVRLFDEAPALCIDPAGAYTATFATSAGDIVVELRTADVPGTVNNFVTLARYGYYDDTLLFRADPSIDIVQGGGDDNDTSPGYTIPDEAGGFTYEPGDVAMARLPGTPNSAGGQFFFVGGPNASQLDADGTYVVFGTITDGLDLVEEILAGADAETQAPAEPITLDTVTITQGSPPTASTAAATATTSAPTGSTAAATGSSAAPTGPTPATVAPTTNPPPST